MNCPQCSERNPSHAENCMHCGALLSPRKSAPPPDFGQVEPEEPEADRGTGDTKLVSWIGLALLVLLAAYNWDAIKNWWWSEDFHTTKCVHRGLYDPADFPESEGWERYDRNPTDSRYKRGEICFRRSQKKKDVIDERFHPEEVKNAE